MFTLLSTAIFAVIVYRWFVRDPRMWGPISKSAKRRFAAWCAASAAFAVAASVITVHEARALPPGKALGHPTGWALACVAAIVVLAVAAGVFVFTVETPLTFVLIWGTFGAAIIAIVPGVVVAAMGEEGKNGIVGTCQRVGSCASFANGLAGFYADTISLALAAGVLCLAAFGVKRLVR